MFDELAKTKKDELALKKSQLFDLEKLGEIKSIETPGVKLLKRNGFFYTTNGALADSKKLDYFFDRLFQIRIKRILKAHELEGVDPKEYFPNPRDMIVFTFGNDKLSFLLGKKLHVDQSFYMKILKKGDAIQLIAHDPSLMEAPYLKKDNAISPRKYLRIKALFFLNEKYFKNNHLFKEKDFETFSLNRASITNIRNKSFNLDFSKKNSSPEIYPELSYLLSAFVKFEDSIKNLVANESYYSYVKTKLKEKLSTIILESSGKTYKLELFRRYGDFSGYFVTSSFDKVLYELEGKSAAIFFLNVQDFWNRRPLPFQFGKKDEIFEMSFSKRDRLKLKLPYRKEFQVLMDEKNKEILPIKKNFTELFSLLVRQADYVSQSKFLNLEKVKSKIQLYFDGFAIHAILKNDELLLFNQVKKIIYHYRANDAVKLDIKDYFRNAGSLL